jgi:hypothetical protein
MKLFLLTCFFSPLLTVSFIYYLLPEKHLDVSVLAQPCLFTAVLFWIWRSASQHMSAKGVSREGTGFGSQP